MKVGLLFSPVTDRSMNVERTYAGSFHVLKGERQFRLTNCNEENSSLLAIQVDLATEIQTTKCRNRETRMF
jgi:hypothetical protein